MMNLSIVKGFMALVGLCACMSMAQKSELICKAEDLKVTLEKYDGVPKNLGGALYDDRLVFHDLNAFSEVNFSISQDIRYVIKVYQRTESSSYYSYKVANGGGEKFLYGRYVTTPYSFCGSQNGPIWVSDYLGKDLDNKYISYSPAIGDFTESFATFDIIRKPKKKLAGTLPSGESYLTYIYDDFDSYQDERNKKVVHDLVDSLKKYDIRHVRLAFDSVSYGYEYGTYGYRVSYVGDACGFSLPLCQARVITNYIDLDISYTQGVTSLSPDSIVLSGHVKHYEPFKIYADMKGDKSFKYVLQYQWLGDNTSIWPSWWSNMKEDEGVVDAATAKAGFSHSFSVPTEYFASNSMRLRYMMIPYDDYGNEMKDTTYTGDIEVQYSYRLLVNTKINDEISGDYKLKSNNLYLPKDFAFNNNVVQVQAIAPAGYKFKCWAEKDNNRPVCSQYTQNPLSIRVIADTTLRALFTPDVDDVKLTTFISSYEDKTYDSPEKSPVEVDVIDLSKLQVTFSVVASEDQCPLNNAGTKRFCDAELYVRKDGTDEWNFVAFTRANTNNGFTQTHTTKFSLSQNSTNYQHSLLLNDGARFELKAVVNKADGSVAESNSIFVNRLYKVKISGCEVTDGYVAEGDCGATFEDELGNRQTVKKNKAFASPYGSKIKMYPLYNYNYDFYGWKLRTSDDILSSESAYEFTLTSDSTFIIVVDKREKDKIRILSNGVENPYAGMSFMDLFISDDSGLDFAADTAFYITKNGLAGKFAVNKLDSAFTPGDYSMTIKLTHKDGFKSERDSLWACNSIPTLLWQKEEESNYTVNKTACTETAPAVYYYHMNFKVDGAIVYKEFTAKDGKVLSGAVIDGIYRGADAINVTTETNVDTVVFNREFSTSGFSTITLPFDINAANLVGVKSVLMFAGKAKKDGKDAVGMKYLWCDTDVQASLAAAAGSDDFDHCNTDKENFSGDMVAYTPYMVEMESGAITFKGKVTLKPTPAVAEVKVDGSDWVFRSTLQKKTWDEGDADIGKVWGYIATSPDEERFKIGEFYKFGPGSFIRPLRAYIYDPYGTSLYAAPKKANASDAAKSVVKNDVEKADNESGNIDVVIVRGGNSSGSEEHTTVIGTINARTGELRLNRDGSRTYDLKGRSFDGKPKTKGIYLKK